jgi:hypothetical protein
MSHEFLTVKAVVKETAPDRQGAWQLANDLCDAILDLGYEFSGALTRIGAETSWRTEPPTWQGTIELRLKPA